MTGQLRWASSSTDCRPNKKAVCLSRELKISDETYFDFPINTDMNNNALLRGS